MKKQTYYFLKTTILLTIFLLFIFLSLPTTVGRAAKNENNIKVKSFSNVEKMKSSDLSEGETVSTLGYYKNSDGGEGTYTIVKSTALKANNGSIIQLNNGLKAVLNIENDTVSVAQFGAKGDGITDDTVALNHAFNSGIPTVTLQKNASYKATDSLILSTSNLTIQGFNSTLFTDNDYKPYTNYHNDCFFLYIKCAQNITLDGINVISNETKRIGHGLQLMIRYSSNIIVNNCHFLIPETVLSEDRDTIRKSTSYCNISLCAGWKNVSVTNCSFINLSGSNYGGLIGVNGIWNTDNKTALFDNNVCLYKGHDEIIAITSSEDSKVSDVTFSNNRIMNEYDAEKDFTKPADICFSIGYNNSLSVDNVTLSNNQISAQSDFSMIQFGNATNVTIENNTIRYAKLTQDNQIKPYMFYGSKLTANDNITIKDNMVALSSGNSLMGGIGYGKFNITNNQILCDAKAYILFQNCSSVEKNAITTNYAISGIGQGLYNFSKNTVTLNAYTGFMLQYYAMTLKQDVIIDQNVFQYVGSNSSGTTFLSLNGTTLNNQQVIVSNNQVDCTSPVKSNSLCYLSIKDATAQTINFIGNSMVGFSSITKYQCTIQNHNLISK